MANGIPIRVCIYCGFIDYYLREPAVNMERILKGLTKDQCLRCFGSKWKRDVMKREKNG